MTNVQFVADIMSQNTGITAQLFLSCLYYRRQLPKPYAL